jgi:hypothetical protein
LGISLYWQWLPLLLLQWQLRTIADQSPPLPLILHSLMVSETINSKSWKAFFLFFSLVTFCFNSIRQVIMLHLILSILTRFLARQPNLNHDHQILITSLKNIIFFILLNDYNFVSWSFEGYSLLDQIKRIISMND